VASNMESQTSTPTYAEVQGTVKPLYWKIGEDQTIENAWVNMSYRNAEDAPSEMENARPQMFQSGSEEWLHEGVMGLVPLSTVEVSQLYGEGDGMPDFDNPLMDVVA